MSALAKVLLVEDNVRICSQLQALLESMGLEVFAAATGIEALLTYNRVLPHLVILEQFLPLLSGEEVVRRLRERCSPTQLPVVMLVSSRFGGLSQRARGEVNVVLEKPLQAQTFYQAIQQVFSECGAQFDPQILQRYTSPKEFYLLWGDLDEESLPSLLFQMHERRQTGLLTISLPKGDRRIAFLNGALTYAESLIPDEQFTAFLQRRSGSSSLLTGLEQITAGSGARAVLQREALLRAEVLKPLELEPLYRLYCEHVVIRSLFLQQAPYQLIDDHAYVERASKGDEISLLPLVFEGVQYYYSPAQLLQTFAPLRNQVCQISPLYSQMIPPLVEKFPSISFSPHRLNNRSVGHLLDELSSNPQLNAQLLQTLLVSKLLLIPLTDSDAVGGVASAWTEKGLVADDASEQLTQPRSKSFSKEEQDSFPSSDAYRSSLPPLPPHGNGKTTPSHTPNRGHHPSTNALHLLGTDNHPNTPPPQALKSQLTRTGQQPPNRLMRSGQQPGPLMRPGQQGPRALQYPRTNNSSSGRLMRSGQQGSAFPPSKARPDGTGRPRQPERRQKKDRPMPVTVTPLPLSDERPESAKRDARQILYPSDDPTFLQKLDDDYLRVQSDDYFRILGLSPTSSDEEIRTAYKEYLSLYHTDRFKKEPKAEVRAKANEIFRRVSQACAVLSTPHARKNYEEQRKQRKGQIKNRLLHAKEEFEQGEYFLKQKRYREAIPHFREAIEHNEKDPAYYLRLGWALFRSNPKDSSTALLARTYIEKALRMNPIFEDAYYYLGYIRKEEGNYEQAAALLQRILLLNPGHADAHQMLAELSQYAQNQGR